MVGDLDDLFTPSAADLGLDTGARQAAGGRGGSSNSGGGTSKTAPSARPASSGLDVFDLVGSNSAASDFDFDPNASGLSASASASSAPALVNAASATSARQRQPAVDSSGVAKVDPDELKRRIQTGAASADDGHGSEGIFRRGQAWIRDGFLYFRGCERIFSTIDSSELRNHCISAAQAQPKMSGGVIFVFLVFLMLWGNGFASNGRAIGPGDVELLDVGLTASSSSAPMDAVADETQEASRSVQNELDVVGQASSASARAGDTSAPANDIASLREVVERSAGEIRNELRALRLEVSRLRKAGNFGATPTIDDSDAPASGVGSIQEESAAKSSSSGGGSKKKPSVASSSEAAASDKSTASASKTAALPADSAARSVGEVVYP